MFQYDEDMVNSSADSPTLGPYVPLSDAYVAARDAANYETYSGLNELYYEQYFSQRKKLKEMSIDAPGIIDPGSLLAERDLTVGQVYSALEGGDSTFDKDMVKKHEERIKELQAQYPDAGFKTIQEMLTSAETTAKQYALTSANQRRSFAGEVAAFAGGVASQVNPKYNFWNFATLPAGGFGKSIVGRIATEASVQAGIEGVNEFVLGNRETRARIGLDSDLQSSLSRVGVAAAGGAVIRGGLEFGSAGLRKLSEIRAARREARAETPKPDPVSEHLSRQEELTAIDPELATTARGSGRIISDQDEILRKVDSWDGPNVDSIKPDMPESNLVIDQSRIDVIAREVDPETFKVYDALKAKREAALTELAQDRANPEGWVQAIAEANDAVVDATEKLGNRKLKPKERRALEAQREQAMVKRDELMFSAGRKEDTPRQAELRERAMQYDYKMRDMAPTVSRAYARARGQYAAEPVVKEAVADMVKQRGSALSDSATRKIRDAETAPKQNLFSEPDPKTITAEQKAVQEAIANNEKALESFKAEIAKVLEDGKIKVGDVEVDLNLKVGDPDAGDATLTLRDLLEDAQRAKAKSEAMTSCSI